MATTYQDFLKTVKPEMLDANGRFRGPGSGVNFLAEGMTPEEFYSQQSQVQKYYEARGQGSGDNLELGNDEGARPISAEWRPGAISTGSAFQGGSSFWGPLAQFVAVVLTAGTASGAFSGAEAGTIGGEAAAATGDAGFSGIGGASGWNAAMDSQAANLGFGSAQAAVDAGAMAPAAGIVPTAGSVGATMAANGTPAPNEFSGIDTGSYNPGADSQAANVPGGTSVPPSAAADAKSGMSLTDLASKYGPQIAKAALGALSGTTAANIGGAALNAATNRSVTSQQQDAINQSADIIAPAYTAAGKLLSDAQTQGAQTLASGYTTSAAQQAAGATQAGDIRASGYEKAGQLGTQGLQGASREVQDTLESQLALQKPYQQAGMAALGTLSEGLKEGGQFNRSFSTEDMKNVMPAFTFARDQALAAQQAQMARGGQNLSSNAIQGAGTLAAGLASQYEGQAFQQWLAQNNLTLGALQQMVGTGQISTGQLANALQSAGVSQAGIQTAIGQVQGQAAVGASGARATGVQQAADATAGGTLGAARATSAGQIGAANATAQGDLGAAATRGGAKLQTGNVGAAGTAQQGNTWAGLFSSVVSPLTGLITSGGNSTGNSTGTPPYFPPGTTVAQPVNTGVYGPPTPEPEAPSASPWDQFFGGTGGSGD